LDLVVEGDGEECAELAVGEASALVKLKVELHEKIKCG
jgi:hypothetical protein